MTIHALPHRRTLLRVFVLVLLVELAMVAEPKGQESQEPTPSIFADNPFRRQNQPTLAEPLNLGPLISDLGSRPAALWSVETKTFQQSFEQRSDTQSTQEPGFNWSGALKQSGLLLGVQHSLRMLQEKTRNRLDGKWWQDYLTSIEGLQGWNDGNPIITNYVGHPLMGAITGYIQIQNDPRGILLEWAPHDANYWKSRMKAMFWTALYSTQYELGPLGEAMIGNVGFDRGTMGYVDLVVTPTGGLAMILLEDWLDKRVVAKLERGKSERQARFLRVILNPQRSIANLLRFKRPSHRDTRPLALP